MYMKFLIIAFCADVVSAPYYRIMQRYSIYQRCIIICAQCNSTDKTLHLYTMP